MLTDFHLENSSSVKKEIILSQFETPLGMMFAAAIDDGICLLEFSDRNILDNQIKLISKKFNSTVVQGSHKLLDLLQIELHEYFTGKRKAFSLPVVTHGTAFQELVWNELKHIPYGSTRSYKAQSLALKKPEAIRAVAHANGLNPISILIPCHRVIGENGSLTGYGGGLWRKRWLLDLESNQNQLLFDIS